MKEINVEHTNKLFKQLGGESGETNLLKNILKVDSNKINSDWFFEYFFISNDIIKNHQNRLIELILSDQNFHVVHGFAKNGKSTFIKNTIREFNNKGNLLEGYNLCNIKLIYTVYYDFQYLNNSDFIEKIKQLFKISFVSYGNPSEQRTYNLNIRNFHKAIRAFLNKILTNNIEMIPQYELVVKSLQFVERKLEDFVFQTDDSIGLGKLERVSEIFDIYICNDINEENIEQFFIYKVMYDIFIQISKNIFNKSEKAKIVFILDNIDEYLKDNDFFFLKHPQVILWSFFKELFETPEVSVFFYEAVIEYSGINENEIKQITFDFKTQICFIYVFRTANFLAFAQLMREIYVSMSETKASFLPSAILGTNYIRYSTIECTTEIINQRLERFYEIIGGGRISKPPKGYMFLKNMTKLLNTKTNDDSIREKYRNIFNLWNGDKVKLFEYIIMNWNYVSEKYYNSEELVEKIVKMERLYLNKGIYIHFFLDLLKKDNVVLDDLLNHILYSFVDESKKGKNIRRIILNIITNVSEKNKRNYSKLHISNTFSNIPLKGIGLYDLLDKIQKYIDEVNDKDYYDFNDVKQFFLDICDIPKIDFFAQLISIYKNPTKSSAPLNYTNYYNINKEIERFLIEKSACKLDLNKIRVFNNNNAAYLTSSLLSNFEYFSFIIGNDFKPLVLSVNRKNNLTTIDSIVDFDFYDIIEAVYEKVKCSLDDMAEFYLKKLILNYPPNVFVKDEKFSIQMEPHLNRSDSNVNLVGNFQIRMIIARHFTYLEDFRELILCSSNLFKIQSEERDKINNYLLDILEKYNKLFISKYEDILNKLNSDNLNVVDNLNAKYMDNDYLIRKGYCQNFIDIKNQTLNPFVKLDEEIYKLDYSKITIID